MKRGVVYPFFLQSGTRISSHMFWDHPSLPKAVQRGRRVCRLALAMDVAPRPMTLHSGCRAVVRTWHLPLEKQLAANQMYAGLTLSSCRDEKRANTREVSWTKSHRRASWAVSKEEAREIRRNDEVDFLAQEALEIQDDDAWEWA